MKNRFEKFNNNEKMLIDWALCYYCVKGKYLNEKEKEILTKLAIEIEQNFD